MPGANPEYGGFVVSDSTPSAHPPLQSPPDAALVPVMLDYFNTPFFWGLLTGLAIGLLAVAWIGIGSMLRRKHQLKETGTRLAAVHAEVETLRQHLHTQLQITAKGTEQQQQQLATLKVENENLRILVQSLQQKPERAAQRTLEVWQRAVERMTSRAPGFAQAWQDAVNEGEAEVTAAESGLTKFVRKFLGRGAPALPAPESPAKDSPEA